MNAGRSCLLISYAGSHNLGDDLMLLGALEHLQTYDKVLVTSKHCSKQFLPDSVEFIGTSLRTFLPALWRSQALLMCGGTWFHDSVAASNRWRLQLALMKVVCLFALARILGKKVRLLRIGVGPIRSRLTNWIATCGLWVADEVTVRDAASRDWAKRLGLGTVPIEEDFGGEYLAQRHTRAPPTARIVISPVMCDEFENPEDAAEFWLELASDAARGSREFCSDAEVTVLPFCYADGVDGDAPMFEIIRQRLSSGVKLIDWIREDCSIQQLIDLSEGTLFLASRYHSLIFASRFAATVLALTYHEKCVAFANEVHLRHILPRPQWRTDQAQKIVRAVVAEHFGKLARNFS